MNRIAKEFVSEESKDFKFKIGHFLASSLSGYIAGIICATIVWGYVIAILLSRQ